MAAALSQSNPKASSIPNQEMAMKNDILETQPGMCRDGAELQQWSCAPKKLSVIYLTRHDPSSGADATQSQQEGLTRCLLLSLFFSFVTSVLESELTVNFLLLLLFFSFARNAHCSRHRWESSLALCLVLFSVVGFFCRLSGEMKKVVIRSTLSDEHWAWWGETVRGAHLSPSAPKSHLAPLSIHG